MLNTLFILPLLLATGQTPQATPEHDVRVAVVAYEDFGREFRTFQRLFAEISEQDPAFRFRMAVGSYGDVLHWIDRGHVDLAILTPGVFASLIPSSDGDKRLATCEYLTTVLLPAASTKWASEERRTRANLGYYRSVCLVAEGSALRSVDDLRRATLQNRVEYLFVHPLSVSGNAAPREALREAGIDLRKAPIRFTYSHSQSIRMARKRAGERDRVAFVWDDAAGNDHSLEEGVRRLPFRELDSLAIPHDVIVVRENFPHAERLRQLLIANVNSQQRYRFGLTDDWQQRFQRVRRWLKAAHSISLMEGGQHASLNEIGRILLQYARSNPQPPRLALVLSGGGAKCSYQVGAVAAIEEKLAALRQLDPAHPLDISLVVGTSGGAINSLPVALGITRTPEGCQQLRETWYELDQRDIVRPPLLVRTNMGIWFALLQTVFVLWAVQRFVPEGPRRGWTFAAVYTALAAAEILLGYLPFTPWSWLGTNHVLHHLWLWIDFGARASAWSLFAIGVGALILQTIRTRHGRQISIPRWLTKGSLIAGLLGLPLLQLVTLFAWEETLSGGQGMERALATKFPPLINKHLARKDLPPLGLEKASGPAESLRLISRQLADRKLLQRDLVITGSCLEQTSKILPPDLYFYAPANPAESPPPFGKRGISLQQHPAIALDVILGSSSIFPMFPPRAVRDVPRPGEQITLVDGGFAHNSPVEAAVLWGATHVVLIDVMSHQRSERGSFAKNVVSSFRHLHRQAQMIDARTHGKVIIFTLSPEPPKLCVLDFADNLIAANIERGFRDASIDAASGTPRFLKELGEPVFVDVR